MTPHPHDSIELTLRVGALERRLPLAELAFALGRHPLDVERLCHTLLRLALPEELRLAHPSMPLPPRTEEGGWGEVAERTETDERSERTNGDVGTDPEIQREKRNGNVRTNGTDGLVRPTDARAAEPPQPASHLTAAFLADILDDHVNLSMLARLTEQTPAVLLQAALDETLHVPDHAIRRTRGAYFTAAVRRRQQRGRAGARPAPSI